MKRIDEILQSAMENGEFDNLPGSGKPLSQKPPGAHEDPTTRMAHRIMKDNEVLPPWIAERNEIKRHLDRAREKLSRAWAWRQDASLSELRQADEHWHKSQQLFREKVEGLNKRIFNFNLMAPILDQHLFMIDADREIAKIVNRK